MKTEPVCCWLNMLTEQQGRCLATAQRDNTVSLISAGCWFQTWNLEEDVKRLLLIMVPAFTRGMTEFPPSTCRTCSVYEPSPGCPRQHWVLTESTVAGRDRGRDGDRQTGSHQAGMKAPGF